MKVDRNLNKKENTYYPDNSKVNDTGRGLSTFLLQASNLFKAIVKGR